MTTLNLPSRSTVKLTLTVTVAAMVVRAVYRDGPSAVAHNLVAHPLLELWPMVGEAIHGMSNPEQRGWVTFRQTIPSPG